MKIYAELIRSTRAATAIEYGLIIALIFLASMVAIAGVGDETGKMWRHVGSEIDGAM
ncbi:Flp family type IVb pilin [Sphingopyxis sp. R3-92]|uniref:Flp family type IVb pilin n=1 Tax=Sphingopyxis sp. R3-92 TaxID=3158553 RepID=UPI003EE7BE77